MKRSLADTSTRSTAGCLPVPLFNQKKRTRQPLTSNPIKNEPGTSSGTHAYEFSPTSFVDLNQHSSPVLQEETFIRCLSCNSEENFCSSNCAQKEFCLYASKANLANAGKNFYACRAEEKTPSMKVWNRNEYTPLSNTTDSRSDSGIIRKFENLSNSLKTVQQQKTPDNHYSSQYIKTEINQTYKSKGQWPVKPNTVSKSPAYKFSHNIQQNKMNEKMYFPEDRSQEVSSQLKIKEKKNSLRIISAVIESMRHWSQYTYKTALLFEVLGTLDSAVTPGAYGAKNFLLRDGKETLPCVFYEIDRELPRLIRGRVHRCMGNYDAKKNIFKCVSVRPATIQEQNTFQEFVRIADIEMTAFVKTVNEI
nr:spermatogenesis-associated protein 22 [Columba livia]